MLRDRQTLLTAICFIGLIVSLFFRSEAAAYVSVVFGSYYAITSSWASLKARELDVNVLMIIAAIGSMIVHHVTDAAALLFLFSLSSTLEALAMAKTKSAIEGLMRLRPAQATRLTDSGEETVPVEALVKGDRIRIAPFDGIPVDGKILEGKSAVDQSAMTGESVSVSCGPGDLLLSGTQNLEGQLVMEVSAATGESALDRIVALVSEAQENKASGERISQWFGQRYTIGVLVAFVASNFIRLALHQPLNDAFYGSLTLLVGMSPCALVISTPATTLSALAWAARNGILIRGGEFIERAGEIDIIAMDKTGTLTRGKPRLSNLVVSSNGSSLRSWQTDQPLTEPLITALQAAAGAEQTSNHPLALAVVDAAKTAGLQIGDATEAKVFPGLGLEATVDGAKIWVGKPALLTENGVQITDEIRGAIAQMEAGGASVALMATGNLVAALEFEDRVRPEAKLVLQDLQELGVKQLVMITGDNWATAKTVADFLGIKEFHAELHPDDKTVQIGDLAKKGHVLMVGDGVNDAPSLALASVGVAMGGLGSDIALNAADVVLMNDRLERIPDLIRLGRRTQLAIRANLIFAGTVVVSLTVASLITTLLLPIAVVGHEGSTVLVILNGLRLLQGPGTFKRRNSVAKV